MRERLLANWPLKLLALALAFAIWVSITGQDRTIRDFTVPLEIDLGSERIAAGTPPTTVTVRLEGPQTTIRKLDPLRVAVGIDLQNAALGEREVPLSRSHVTGVPRGVDVTLITPDRISLDLVRRVRRPLQVVPELVGEPPAGRTLYGFAVNPRTITVEGPESAVSAMRTLRTEAIPLEGRTERFRIQVGLVPEDPRVRVVDEDAVGVEIFVDAAPEEKTLKDVTVAIPFATDQPPKIRPGQVDVTLGGPPWLMERIEVTQLAALAEVEPPGSKRAQRVEVRVEVRLPEEHRRLVSVKSIRPTQVSVQIHETTKEGP